MKNELDELLDGIPAPEGLVAESALESLAEEEVAAQEKPKPPEIDKAAIYEAQESKLGVGSEEDAKPKKGKRTKKAAPEPERVSNPEPNVEEPPAKKGRKAKEPAAPKEPKVKLAPATSRSEALLRKIDPTDLGKLGYDPSEALQVINAIDAAPKKVAEKAFNLIRYALGHERISNYTRFTLQQLAAADEGLSVPDLVKLMQDRWGVGTSRSQSQQMSRLFGIYGMVSKDSGKMVLDRGHPFVKEALARLSK